MECEGVAQPAPGPASPGGAYPECGFILISEVQFCCIEDSAMEPAESPVDSPMDSLGLCDPPSMRQASDSNNSRCGAPQPELQYVRVKRDKFKRSCSDVSKHSSPTSVLGWNGDILPCSPQVGASRGGGTCGGEKRGGAAGTPESVEPACLLSPQGPLSHDTEDGATCPLASPPRRLQGCPVPVLGGRRRSLDCSSSGQRGRASSASDTAARGAGREMQEADLVRRRTLDRFFSPEPIGAPQCGGNGAPSRAGLGPLVASTLDPRLGTLERDAPHPLQPSHSEETLDRGTQLVSRTASGSSLRCPRNAPSPQVQTPLPPLVSHEEASRIVLGEAAVSPSNAFSRSQSSNGRRVAEVGVERGPRHHQLQRCMTESGRPTRCPPLALPVHPLPSKLDPSHVLSAQLSPSLAALLQVLSSEAEGDSANASLQSLEEGDATGKEAAAGGAALLRPARGGSFQTPRPPGGRASRPPRIQSCLATLLEELTCAPESPHSNNATRGASFVQCEVGDDEANDGAGSHQGSAPSFLADAGENPTLTALLSILSVESDDDDEEHDGGLPSARSILSSVAEALHPIKSNLELPRDSVGDFAPSPRQLQRQASLDSGMPGLQAEPQGALKSPPLNSIHVSPVVSPRRGAYMASPPQGTPSPVLQRRLTGHRVTVVDDCWQAGRQSGASADAVCGMRSVMEILEREGTASFYRGFAVASPLHESLKRTKRCET